MVSWGKGPGLLQNLSVALSALLRISRTDRGSFRAHPVRDPAPKSHRAGNRNSSLSPLRPEPVLEPKLCEVLCGHSTHVKHTQSRWPGSLRAPEPGARAGPAQEAGSGNAVAWGPQAHSLRLAPCGSDSSSKSKWPCRVNPLNQLGTSKQPSQRRSQRSPSRAASKRARRIGHAHAFEMHWCPAVEGESWNVPFTAVNVLNTHCVC